MTLQNKTRRKRAPVFTHADAWGSLQRGFAELEESRPVVPVELLRQLEDTLHAVLVQLDEEVARAHAEDQHHQHLWSPGE